MQGWLWAALTIAPVGILRILLIDASRRRTMRRSRDLPPRSMWLETRPDGTRIGFVRIDNPGTDQSHDQSPGES
ncbi:MAG: hypothetical protein QOE58_525 [Actinomycetota bacterium]|jgi:hypothetical protein|nr:hypothetical protein [Actinomycetota bacterium]